MIYDCHQNLLLTKKTSLLSGKILLYAFENYQIRFRIRRPNFFAGLECYLNYKIYNFLIFFIVDLSYWLIVWLIALTYHILKRFKKQNCVQCMNYVNSQNFILFGHPTFYWTLLNRYGSTLLATFFIQILTVYKAVIYPS